MAIPQDEVNLNHFQSNSLGCTKLLDTAAHIAFARAPEKRYSTLKRLLGLGDTCIGETDFTFSQSPAPAFGVAALLVSLPPDLHDDLG